MKKMTAYEKAAAYEAETIRRECAAIEALSETDLQGLIDTLEESVRTAQACGERVAPKQSENLRVARQILNERVERLLSA